MLYFIGGLFCGMILMFGIMLLCAYISLQKKKRAVKEMLHK